MAEIKEVIETGIPDLDDKVQICSFHGKTKEKLGEVLSCCSSNHNDSKEPQKELDAILAPFHNYCGLESSEQKVQLGNIKEQLGKVLGEEKAKHESTYKANSREFRKKWKNRRIIIYDYLLRLTLHDPNESQDLWIKGQECTDHFYAKAAIKLKPDTFYTYLVDQIHEDEEIMFKFYCVNNGEEKSFVWRKGAAWLVGSIIFYSQIVMRKAFKALEPWKDEDQLLCNNLVKKAKEQFVDKLSNLHGRSFKKERNWRNRARFYYLLGLARHTKISNGHFGKFKNSECEEPYCRLVREMIIEDKDLFDQESKGHDFPLVCKTKYEKQNNTSFLGHLKVDRLLAWASAANDLGFVRVVLKYYLDSMKSCTNFDFIWEKSILESWAQALWNASYKGHARIVKELLSWEIPYHSYYSEYFSKKTNILLHKSPCQLQQRLLYESPLHIAVLRRDALVVDAFCTTTSPYFNCNEQNCHGLTPLEVAIKMKDTNDKDVAIKKKIQNLLLQRPEVKDAIAEAISRRQIAVDSSNAVMVGGTLIAGITFSGWLSPPLGYNSYYQLAETATAAPPDSYESYMSVQGHLAIQFFAIFNSLSFYFAIASVIAGLETFGAIQTREGTQVVNQVNKLRKKFTWATSLFLASVLCVLVAFSCAGIAVLPPIKKYQINMYITTAIGGFICVLFICKMVRYILSKVLKNKVIWKFFDFYSILDKGHLKLFSQTMD